MQNILQMNGTQVIGVLDFNSYVGTQHQHFHHTKIFPHTILTQLCRSSTQTDMAEEHMLYFLIAKNKIYTFISLYLSI